ncbi:hypothetical protein ACOME3_003805 [Neoechinorhynchus agilis]
MALGAMSFFIFKNRAKWRKVSRDIMYEIDADREYYIELTSIVPDANLSQEDILADLNVGKVPSARFVIEASANFYGVDLMTCCPPGGERLRVKSRACCRILMPIVNLEGYPIDSITDDERLRYLGGETWATHGTEEFRQEIDETIKRVENKGLSFTQSVNLLNDYAVPSILGRIEGATDSSMTSINDIESHWQTRLKPPLRLPHFLNNGAMFLLLSKEGLRFRSIKHDVINSLRLAFNEIIMRSPHLEKLVRSTPDKIPSKLLWTDVVRIDNVNG